MKSCVWFVWILVLFSVPQLAQELIENPAKPKNPDAGRILEIREELGLLFLHRQRLEQTRYS